VPWDPGPRPTWVQDIIDGRGAPFVAAVADAPLTRDVLLDEARVRTGLGDFGDDAFVEALDVLLASANDEARFHVVGRARFRETIVHHLANRLRLREHVRRDPGVVDEEIAAPLVVTGSPRSGTSILHQLLAQDGRHRAPLAWELWCPTPPPEPATHATDARIRLADVDVRMSAWLAPHFDGRFGRALGRRLWVRCRQRRHADVIVTFLASGPFAPCSASNCTFAFSVSDL